MIGLNDTSSFTSVTGTSFEVRSFVRIFASSDPTKMRELVRRNSESEVGADKSCVLNVGLDEITVNLSWICSKICSVCLKGLVMRSDILRLEKKLFKTLYICYKEDFT